MNEMIAPWDGPENSPETIETWAGCPMFNQILLGVQILPCLAIIPNKHLDNPIKKQQWNMKSFFSDYKMVLDPLGLLITGWYNTPPKMNPWCAAVQEEFEAAGRAALSIYGSAETSDAHGRWRMALAEDMVMGFV